MNSNTTNPLTYEEACHAYLEWSKAQLGKPQAPSGTLSEEYDGLWHLENIGGPLAIVTAAGEVVPVADFYAAYERLSMEGKCDGAGGAEYRRVLGEWIEDDQPENLDEFIHRRANVGPWDIDGLRGPKASEAATKKLKVTLAGQEVVSVSADLVVEVPMDTTAVELAGMGTEAVSDATDPDWQLGEVDDREIDQIVGMQLCEGKPDVTLVRGSAGKLVTAEE